MTSKVIFTVITHCRFVVDWIVLINNKHKLRRYITKINKILKKLQLHKGFDFFGFHFNTFVKKYNSLVINILQKWMSLKKEYLKCVI